jgi:hypothetical protein
MTIPSKFGFNPDRGRSHEQLENDVSIPDKPKWNNVSLVEPLFLSEFIVRGDFTQQEFEVTLKT